MSPLDDASISASTVRLADTTAYQDFGDETVALNLNTGNYHGLNATASQMLEVLAQEPRVDRAAALLVSQFDAPEDQIRADLIALCRALLERGLLVCE